jgi:hypothetical protein
VVLDTINQIKSYHIKTVNGGVRVAQYLVFCAIFCRSLCGGRSWSTRREPPTMDKQLVNFITCGCELSAPLLVIYNARREHTFSELPLLGILKILIQLRFSSFIQYFHVQKVQLMYNTLFFL